MKTPKPSAELNVCSNCGLRNVTARRPSATGHHWCKAPDCQRAKSRHYYVKRGEADAARRERARLDFLRVAVHAERKTCPGCGLTDAMPGYPHPTSEGKPCFELGMGGRGLLTSEWIDVAMPPESRTWSLL